MSGHSHPRPRRRPGRRAGRRLAALLLGALAATVALTGCDLRLEGPPPSAPTPGPVEQVRARTVTDAVTLAAAATAARPAADEATGAVLDDVAAFSAQHADQLGGVYDSGLPEPTDTSTPTPVTATPDEVLTALRADATTALTDAAAVDDGALARLVAAVGVARASLASRLAVALGEPDAATSPEPTASAPATLAPSVAPSATPAPSGTPALPGGLTVDDAAALALAHDQAGFALEVVAAKLDGEERATTYAAAAEHRVAGEAWARRAAIAGTPADPRRAAYALPADVDDPAGARALAAGLEAGVANAASAALVHTAAGAREDLLGELRTATAAAASWGGAPAAFPGLPDLG